MNDARKKSNATLWVLAIVIGLPILYFLSVGPVTFLVLAIGEPEWVDTAYGMYMMPFWSVRDGVPEPLKYPFYAYPQWWMRLAMNLHQWFPSNASL